MNNALWGVALLLHPFVILISTQADTIRYGRDLAFLLMAVAFSMFYKTALPKWFLPVFLLPIISLYSGQYFPTDYGHYSPEHVYQFAMFLGGLLCISQFYANDINIEKYIAYAGLMGSIAVVLDYMGLDIVREYASLSMYKIKTANLVSGLLQNKNHSGAFIALCLPSILSLKKFFYLPLIGVSLYLCDSVMPVITAAAAVFYYYFPFKYLYFTGAMLTGLAYNYFPHVTGSFDNGRLLIWDQFLRYETPFFGNGLGWFSQAYHKMFQPLGGHKVLHLHNELLESYAAFGFFGVIVLGYFLYKCTKGSCKASQAGMFALFVNSLGNFPMHMSPIALLGCYYIGKNMRGVK